jgi:hypothetical protein
MAIGSIGLKKKVSKHSRGKTRYALRKSGKAAHEPLAFNTFVKKFKSVRVMSMFLIFLLFSTSLVKNLVKRWME